MSDSNKESFGDTLLGYVIAFGFLFLLFNGEPSIADSLRVIVENYASEVTDE